MTVVVVQRLSGRVVLVVVVVAATNGAQRSFTDFVVAVWLPNWSAPPIVGRTCPHFAL
jgi:hypothetical protein